MAEKKRSSERTSYEVRRRWDQANLKKLTFSFSKETAEAFRAKCESLGITQSSVIKDAVDNFLKG